MTNNNTVLTELLYRHVYGRVEKTKWYLEYCTTEFCMTSQPPSDYWFDIRQLAGLTEEQIYQEEVWLRACHGHERVESREIGMLRSFRFRGADLVLIIHPWDAQGKRLSSKTALRFADAESLQIWPHFNGFRNHLRGYAKIDVSLSSWSPLLV